MNGGRNMKRKLIIGGLVLLIIGLVGFKFLSKKVKAGGPVVDTITLEKGDIEKHIKSTGTIVSMDKREVTSDVEENIEKMYVKKGDKVKAGQVLMKLDETHIRQKINEARIRLEIEEETLKKAEQNQDMDLKIGLENIRIKNRDLKGQLDRSEELYKAGAITKVELDRARDEYNQNNNELLLAEDRIRTSTTETDKNLQRKRVELARIDLRNLEKDLDKYTIKSPISGTIVETKISESGIVESHKMLMSIQDIDNLEVVVDMSEYDVEEIKVGDRVTITGDSLKGEKFSGEVKHIAYVTTNALNEAGEKGKGGSVEVRMSIKKGDKAIKPGTTAKTDIIAQSKKNVFKLSFESLYTDENGDRNIFVVENNKVRKLKVETGMETDFEIEIKGDLKEGMEVIRNPNEGIQDGDTVTVVKEL